MSRYGPSPRRSVEILDTWNGNRIVGSYGDVVAALEEIRRLGNESVRARTATTSVPRMSRRARSARGSQAGTPALPRRSGSNAP
jgi:hypothetical protein